MVVCQPLSRRSACSHTVIVHFVLSIWVCDPRFSGCSREDGHKKLLAQVDVWQRAQKTTPRVFCGIYTHQTNHVTKTKVSSNFDRNHKVLIWATYVGFPRILRDAALKNMRSTIYHTYVFYSGVSCFKHLANFAILCLLLVPRTTYNDRRKP